MNRDLSIDMIRALSIIYVIVILHISDYTQLYNMEGIFVYCITSAAMGAFMFISGFLLKRKYEITGMSNVGCFFRRRFFRIIPLYLLAVFYFVLIGDMPWLRVLVSVIGLSAFMQPMTNTLWFVEMIWLFYLLYPILWSEKVDKILFKSTLVYLLFLLFDKSVSSVDVRFFYYFPCFALGLVLPSQTFERYKKSWRLTSVALSFFLLLAFALDRGESSGIAYCILIAIVSVLGMAVITFVSNMLSKNVRGGGILFVSYVSMAAYMFHRQILYMIYHIYWPEDGVWRLLYLLFVCLPIIVLVSYIIQKVYDKLLSMPKINKYVR